MNPAVTPLSTAVDAFVAREHGLFVGGRWRAAEGGETIQSLLNWLGQYALWACLAAILAGGGMYAWGRRSGGHGMAITGTGLALGGGVGTILVGLGPAIVNSLYQIT